MIASGEGGENNTQILNESIKIEFTSNIANTFPLQFSSAEYFIHTLTIREIKDDNCEVDHKEQEDEDEDDDDVVAIDDGGGEFSIVKYIN